MTTQSILHNTFYSVALLTMCFNFQINKESNQMKKIFAGLCLSLSTLACAGAKNLVGKRLVLDLPDTECAGLSFAKMVRTQQCMPKWGNAKILYHFE